MPPSSRNPDQSTTITELSILNSYLLPPSSLPTIISYNDFLKLVPLQHRSHPQLKRLYRDIQFQRSIDVDTVRENNLRESGSRASVLRARLLGSVAAENASNSNDKAKRKRKRNGTPRDSSVSDSEDDEFSNPVVLSVNRAVESHPTAVHPAEKLMPSKARSVQGVYHGAESLLDAMEDAVRAVESETADIEKQIALIMEQMQETVGGLSDLRYGKFDGSSGRGSGGAGEDSGGRNGRGNGSDVKVLDALDELSQALRRASGTEG